MDLPAILAGQIDTTNSSIKKTTDVISANAAKDQQTLAGMQQVYDQIATDQRTVTAATAAAKLNTQAATSRVVDAVGADPNNAANTLVDLATRAKSSIEATNKSYDELYRLANIKPTEDFMGFLGAQFFGVADARSKFRENLGRSQLATAQVAQVNKIVLDANSTYKAAETPITVASADAATRLAASEAQINAQKTALEATRYGTEAMLRATQLSKEQLGLLFQTQNADMAVQAHQLALKTFNLHREQFDWQKDEKKILDDARLEGKQLDQHIVDNINIGYAALGLPPVDPREARILITQFKAGKADLLEAYDRGRATQTMGIPVIGTSPADSIDSLTAHPEAVIPESRNATVRLLGAARDVVLANPLYKNEKNKKVVDKAINDQVDTFVKQQYSNVNANPDNIFYLGDLKQYLGSSSGDPRQIPPPYAIGISPLYTKLLKPLVESGADMSDPATVMRMVSRGVVNKTITFEEAVDISTVYRQAVMINLQAKGLTSFGIVPENAGRTLNVRMGAFTGKMDITNPVDVSRFLSYELGAGGAKGMQVPEEAYLRKQ